MLIDQTMTQLSTFATALACTIMLPCIADADCKQACLEGETVTVCLDEGLQPSDCEAREVGNDAFAFCGASRFAKFSGCRDGSASPEGDTAKRALDGNWTITICPRSSGCATRTCGSAKPLTIKDRQIRWQGSVIRIRRQQVSQSPRWRHIQRSTNAKFRYCTFERPQSDDIGCSGTIALRRR